MGANIIQYAFTIQILYLMIKRLFILIVCFISAKLFSQIQYSSPNSLSSNIIQNLSGPRVGLTLLTNGDLTKLYLMNLV